MDDHKLMLALDRKRTEVTYGCAHFCTTHDTIVDADHIDICSHINNNQYKVSEITKPLDGLKSIWDMEKTKLTEMRKRITKLKAQINKLSESKVYLMVHA